MNCIYYFIAYQIDLTRGEKTKEKKVLLRSK